MPPDYAFRPLVRSDRRLFDDWLAQPHIGGWWGDAATEWALIEEDWATANTATDMRIVELDGHPFAYVQDFEVHTYPMPHYAQLPNGAHGMDSFLGDPAYLGQSHGAGFLRQRARQLLAAGAPLIAVDPDPDNTRAIAAYEAAGFRGDTVLPNEDGSPARVMLMGSGL